MTTVTDVDGDTLIQLVNKAVQNVVSRLQSKSTTQLSALLKGKRLTLLLGFPGVILISFTQSK